jgi:hypothetical protein
MNYPTIPDTLPEMGSIDEGQRSLDLSTSTPGFLILLG